MSALLTDLKEYANGAIHHFTPIFVLDTFHLHIAEWRSASGWRDCGIHGRILHGRINVRVDFLKILSLFLFDPAIEFENVCGR